MVSVVVIVVVVVVVGSGAKEVDEFLLSRSRTMVDSGIITVPGDNTWSVI